MSVRTIVVVLLALVCGLSAAFGVQRLVRNSNGERTKSMAVVVATTEISRFGLVTGEMLRVRQVPVDLVPKDAIKSIEEAKDRVALQHLSTHEIVLDSQLAKKGSGLGMAAAIPRGMRGYTIQPAKISGSVGGLLFPGDRVDVLLTVTQAPGGHGSHNPLTLTLLSKVEVLAVDKHVEASTDKKVEGKELRSVTLLVTPEQTAKLTLGQTKGILHLSLRNPHDDQPLAETRITLAEIGLVEELLPQPKKDEAIKEAAAVTTSPELPSARIRLLHGFHEGYIQIISTKPAGGP